MRLLAVIGAVLLTGSILAQADRTPPTIAGPTVIARNPNPAVPLAAIITFDTNEPAVVGIELNGQGGIHRAEPRPLLHHIIPVVGMTAGSSNSIRISLEDAAGNVNPTAGQRQFDAPSLPEDFPPLDVPVLKEPQMEPGFTIFNVSPLNPPSYGLIVAVNGKGQVVWYYRSTGGIGALSQTPRGTLLFLEATDAVEIDMLGNRIARWHPSGAGIAAQPGENIPVATNLFHHEILELPGGNLLTLSHALRRVDSFPSSESDAAAPPAPATLVGDRIVEFARDGRIVREWSLLDLLDSQRIGYDALSGFWDSIYRNAHGPTKDWSHANSVSYDSSDNSFVVSLRSQDAVVKVNRADGRLAWIFGTPGGWNPPWSDKLIRASDGIQWPFHQHAAAMTSRGSVLLFDNGNHRARPFDAKQPVGQSYSRAVEYALDPNGRTTSELWSYGGPGAPNDDLFFSGTLGGAELLRATGNVLITDGARQSGMNRWARIVEVTHTKPAQKVFELIVGEPSRPAARGWTVYRATRIGSFYR
jgi:arylsulfate sulfotransferase